MKKILIRFLCALLALCLLGSSDARAVGFTAFSDMEYSRPELSQMQCQADEVRLWAEGTDMDSILEHVFAFYDSYDWFFTASALAEIHYSADLTNEYWEGEYNYCQSATPTVQQLLEGIYSALAQSPCRRTLEAHYFGSGFFDGYSQEGFWDNTLVSLMEEESKLISRYYEQSRRMNSFLGMLFPGTEDMAQTLAELIVVRNRMAEYAGYDSYEAFANDLYYYRDYSPEELTALLDDIREQLVPLYPTAREAMDVDEEADPNQALDYLRTAAKAMGGKVFQAFRLMEEAELYNIDIGKNKYDCSFEIYLPSYQEPFLFINPAGLRSDCLILTHEFGHFCNDYASFGTIVGVDVSEVFSQGLEYLSLCSHPEARALTDYKLADSLCLYVEQACYTRFEQRMYQLSQPTAQTLKALYEATAAEYGMVDDAFDPWDFVYIPHFYTNPMYVSSYILSNDAAMQLYQLELESPGQGLRLYQRSLDTQQPYFLAFLEEAGLDSPFAPGRLEETAEFFRAYFAG